MSITFSLIFLFCVSRSYQENLNDNPSKNTTISSLGLVTIESENKRESIICRSCGGELTASIDVIGKESPIAQHSFYDTIFDEKEILVQVLPSEFLFSLPVITTKRSNCIGVGEWEEKDTWFPGYQWKPCVCPECGVYVGWIFRPKDSRLIETSDTFFSLILSSLIGESSKYNIL